MIWSLAISCNLERPGAPQANCSSGTRHWDASDAELVDFQSSFFWLYSLFFYKWFEISSSLQSFCPFPLWKMVSRANPSCILGLNLMRITWLRVVNRFPNFVKCNESHAVSKFAPKKDWCQGVEFIEVHCTNCKHQLYGNVVCDLRPTPIPSKTGLFKHLGL